MTRRPIDPEEFPNSFKERGSGVADDIESNFVELFLTAPVILIGGSEAATTNTASINAALAAGGLVQILTPGTYSINGTLITKSDTKFVLGKGVELLQVIGGPGGTNCFNAIRNTNYASALKTITTITAATYSHFMVQVTVNFSASHGLAVGKYLQIKGDGRNIYNGIWRVFSVPTSTSVTFLMSIASSTLAPPSACIEVASASQTVATPGVFTTATNTFVPGQAVIISGAAPGGFVLGTVYYVIYAGLTTTACQLADSPTATTGKQVTSSAACTLTPVLQGYEADANITITGGGKITSQFQAGGFVATGNYRDHGVVLRRVLNPVVDGLEFEDVRKYCVMMQDTYESRVRNIVGHSGADGIHMYGPCINPLIENVSGTFGDDAAIFQPIDGSIYLPFMVGGDSVTALGRFDVGGNFFNGTMRNIRPRHNHNSAGCTIYPNSNAGDAGHTAEIYRMIGTITIDGASMEDPQTSNGANWKPNPTVVVGNGYVTTASRIENLELNGIHGYMRLNNVGGAAVITVNKITVGPGWNISDSFYYDGSELGSYVDGLHIDWMSIGILEVSAASFPHQGESVVTLGSSNATVTQVIFNGVVLNQVLSGFRAPIMLNSSGASVGSAFFNQCQLGPGASFTANSTYAGTPNLHFTGCTGLSGFKNFVENGGTQTMRIFMDACTGVSPSQGGLINTYGTAVISVFVARYVNGGSAPIFANTGGTISYYNADATAPVDVGLMAVTKGSSGYHSSAVAGRNAANQQGNCVCNGTNRYALATGATGVNTLIV